MLTVRQVLETRGVLGDLVIKDKENKYVFSGATRVKLALILRKLNPVQEEFQKENTDLIKELGKPMVNEKGEVQPDNFEVAKDSPEYVTFLARQKELLDAETDIVLTPIPQESIVGNEGDPRSNQIPIDLIGLLFDVGLLTETK